MHFTIFFASGIELLKVWGCNELIGIIQSCSLSQAVINFMNDLRESMEGSSQPHM